MSVTFGMNIDDSQAEAELADLQSKIDRTVEDWRRKRSEIYIQLSELNRSVGLIIQTVRMAAESTGQTIKPYQNAMLNMISSTTSIMLATSAAMGATTILAGAALALAAYAYGFNMAQSAYIIVTSEELKRDIDNIAAQLRALEGSRPSFVGRY